MSIFATYGIIASRVYDRDAVNFLDAALITDATIRRSINSFVKNSKSASIYAKAKAIYPFVGGSAFAHKFNLIDPRDLDAAFRLSYSAAGLTHNSNGITGNGSNGYYNTNLIPSAVLAQNSASMFVYNRLNITVGTGADLGAFSSTGPTGLLFIARTTSNNTQGRCNNAWNSNNGSGITDSRGFYGITRTTGTNFNFITPSGNSTSAQTSTTPPNLKVFGLAYNSNGSANGYIAQNHALSWIGDGLSSSECSTLRTLVNTLQSNLGR